MAVNQAYVDNLALSIESKLTTIIHSYVVKDNNSSATKAHAKDVVRLYSILKILENYDVSETYYDEDFILSINREWKIYCGYNPATSSPSVTNEEEVVRSNFLQRERIYNYNTLSTFSIDDSATGILVPETPILRIDVTIDQENMKIGDETKLNCDVWFSDDGGVTAKAIENINIDDEMYYNALLVGTPLIPTADIEFNII